MKLRIEYYFDDEVERWGLNVPALHIVGGDDTREMAHTRAVEAVKFVLEGVEEEFDKTPGVKVEHFDVQVDEDRMKLRVEYRFDAEVKCWGFAVPALDVEGMADTPEQAERRSIEAVNLALAGVEKDFENGDDIEVEYLDVVAKATSNPGGTSTEAIVEAVRSGRDRSG